MSRQRLPHIGSTSNKTAKPPAQRPHQSRPVKRSQPQASVLVSDSRMAPWGSLDLSESSFTSMSPPRPPAVPPRSPPPPPVPQTTPASPYQTRKQPPGHNSVPNINSNVSTPVPPPQDPGGASQSFHSKRRPLPQCHAPRPPRLPPLRQVTNLSFSRSFTFSFFELPLYQSPRCRAERTKNLLLHIKQVHF